VIGRRRFIELATASLLAPAAFAARAATPAWPTGPVRIVVGFGAALEMAARIVAERLSVLWGQPAVVELKSGAGGNLAAESVARAAPDGHTVLLAGTPLAVNRYLYPSLAYDPVADFAPVSLVSLQPNVMIVPASSPIRSIAEFIAHAKANPGKLTYGSPGHGSSVHLCGELFKRAAGIEMTHVPYRSPPVLMGDLITGRIDTVFPTLAFALPQISSGQARALAVAWPKKVAAAPELPTFTEAGVPGLDEVSLWFGLFVPAKTPEGIVRKLQTDTVEALADPEVRTRFGRLGATPVGSTPAELASHFTGEMKRWGPLIKEARITVNE
jgi:tripartite-type tricarboxylate transporter receptor subunit TctC